MVATDYRSMCSTLSRPLERGCTASCDRIGSIDDRYRTITVTATYTFGTVPDDEVTMASKIDGEGGRRWQ